MFEKKIVKVCLHFSKVVQISLQFDDFFSTFCFISIIEMRGEKSKEDEQDDTENRKRRYTEEGRSKARDRFTQKETSSSSPSGFGRKPRMDDDYSDEDDIDDRDRNRGRGGSRRSTGCKRFLPGAARLPQRRPRPF